MIYVMDPDGADVKQVTPGNRDSFDPTWSPGGDEIALTAQQPQQH